MNVLKVAIVGLALISANTPIRADVIADWNNTAMDVICLLYTSDAADE